MATAVPIRRAVRAIVTWRPVAWASQRLLPRIDGYVLRRSGGRSTFSGWLTGLPIAVLTTTGARTGALRRTPVMAVPVAGAYLVAAANFGSTRQPAWLHNARAEPHVSLDVEGTTHRLVATELAGEERDAGFREALALNPGWVRFRDRAGARGIPILRLDPDHE